MHSRFTYRMCRFPAWARKTFCTWQRSMAAFSPSTPIIDRTRGAIYVIAVSKDGGGNYFHRLHALDLTSGKELFGGPTIITASVPGNGAGSTGGTVTFDPSEYNERPGLLDLNGTIYTTWGSHFDSGL